MAVTLLKYMYRQMFALGHSDRTVQAGTHSSPKYDAVPTEWSGSLWGEAILEQ